MKRTLLASLLLLIGCGGNQSFVPPLLPPPPEQPVISVTVSPPQADVLLHQTLQFTASVTGTTNQGVTWSVREADGGSVTPSGLYQAPGKLGWYNVTARSVAAPATWATAEVSVYAQTVFLEEFPNSTSDGPYSVEPMLASFYLDTPPALSRLTASLTNGLSYYDIALSPDGQCVVFTTITSSGGTDHYNVGTAKIGSVDVATRLTDAEGTGALFTNPQFSPDGQSILYNRQDDHAAIWQMNADGTNKRALFDRPGTYALFPTFSPDGRQIAFELQEPGDGGMLDGTAIMDADGSQVVRLTLNNDSNCTKGLDIMPAFTSDGQQVIFSRECYPLDGGVASALYAVRVNGSTAPNSILGSPGAGYLALQARPFTDGAVLFSSNQAIPGSNAFDIWGIENDGSIPARITDNTLYDGFSLRWMSGRNIVVPLTAAQHHRHDK